MTICPIILKQTKKNENGLEEWERQPCLEEACSLFYAKKKKCSLYHNSEAIHEVRNIMDRIDFVSSFQVIKSGLDALQTGLSGEIRAHQEEIKGRQDVIQERIGQIPGELSGKVQDLIQAFSGDLNLSIQALQVEVKALNEKLSGKIQETLSASEARLESMEKEIEKGWRQGEELHSMVSAGRREAVEKMEALMGKTHEEMRALADGQRKIEAYYDDQKRLLTGEVVRRKKEESREHNNQGVVFFYKGAHEASALAFEKAVACDPEYAEAFNNLGLAYTELDRPEEAVQAFKKALSLRPDLAEAYNNLGLLYYTAMDYERASEMFSKSLDQGCRDQSMGYANFGNSLYQLRRYEEALDAWSRALKINPLNRDAKKGLSLLKPQEQGAV